MSEFNCIPVHLGSWLEREETQCCAWHWGETQVPACYEVFALGQYLQCPDRANAIQQLSCQLTDPLTPATISTHCVTLHASITVWEVLAMWWSVLAEDVVTVWPSVLSLTYCERQRTRVCPIASLQQPPADSSIPYWLTQQHSQTIILRNAAFASHRNIFMVHLPLHWTTGCNYKACWPHSMTVVRSLTNWSLKIVWCDNNS